MAFCSLKFFSESLGRQAEVNVIIPQPSVNGEIGTSSVETTGKYKCLYLLHGLSDDYTIWHRRTSIERYAQDRGICVVMPDGEKSFYTDMKYGDKFYTYIAKELPKLICAMFNVSDKREDNYIAGLSMGGYGALKIGLRECERFCAAAGLSAVADIEARKDTFTDAYVAIFGENMEIPADENLFSLASKQKKNPLRPRIFMGEGLQDFMYDDNQKLKTHFESLDYDFTYRESEGSHCWAFWDEYIVYVLDWMLKEGGNN